MKWQIFFFQLDSQIANESHKKIYFLFDITANQLHT